MADFGPEKKLGFQVVFASGEDPDYPVTELNHHSPNSASGLAPALAPCKWPAPSLPLRTATLSLSQLRSQGLAVSQVLRVPAGDWPAVH